MTDGAPILDAGFDGAIAIVTGGSSGIGLAIAERLAAAKVAVVIAGRNSDTGAAAERALAAGGARVRYVATDVTREDAVERLVDETARLFGPPTILVNNAGPSGEDFAFGAIHEVDAAVLRQSIEIGALGALWCARSVLPHMMAARRGVILNVSAIAADRAIPRMAAYAMGKAALGALGRQIASDYAGYGIRCNNLVVGTVRPSTDDVSTLPADFGHDQLDRAIAATTMMKRLGSYAEAADAALFLLSSHSRYVTGTDLVVDGGASARLSYPDYGAAFAGEAE